jgi:hypothetical protein
MGANRRGYLGGLLTGLVLLAGTAFGAAEPDISFKKRGDAEKAFVTRVGTAIIKAARPGPTKIGLLKYSFTRPKANRTDLNISMEYYGILTKKRYTADIVVLIDSTDKDNWEVVNIRYSDTRLGAHREAKIQQLIKKLNK